MGRIGDGWRRLLRQRRGSTTVIMVSALIPTVAVVGAGIDTGCAYIVKSQLQSGVDAAALAGARAFQNTDGTTTSRTGQVATYFAANFPTGYLSTKNLQVTPTFSTTKNINVTVVTATVDMPTMFMRVLGVTTTRIGAVARAEMQPHPLEVMMVLDNTGSLKANLPKDAKGVVKTRITALKDAAKSFFDILYQGADTREDLGIGMIMYDVTVNVGDLLTKWRSTAVQQVFGFNDLYTKAYLGTWPANKLAWKGCVFDDQTVRDLNSTLTYKEPGAYDIDRVLPTEAGRPAVKPYFIPPFYVPSLPGTSSSAAQWANPTSNAYNVRQNDEAGYNLYKLDPTYADAMLNPAQYWLYGIGSQESPYRRWFYQYYMGLNEAESTKDQDVITKVDGSFYDGVTDKWNFTTNTGTPFRINYDRVPQDTTGKKNGVGRPYTWNDPTDAVVNPQGGSVDNGNLNRTESPNPNWQCPEPATDVQYNRPKSFYVDQIDNHNAAIYPANGTLHHAGLLWGYRLLVRDDVFKRTPPNGEYPKRALIFMTDGETALGTNDNGYTDRTWTFYGNFADAPISASANSLTSQSERRFSKTCASLQAEANPPAVYIVALTTTDSGTLSMFEKCAPGHVYRTSDAATLTAAFQDIASELVDLHLTK